MEKAFVGKLHHFIPDSCLGCELGLVRDQIQSVVLFINIYLIFSAVNVSAVLPECLSQARVWIAEIEILML